MEESISGFKQQGDWVTIVEHGERITEALRDAGAEGEAFDEWDEWRPKAHERLRDDMNEKTAEQATLSAGEGEQADKSPTEDLQTAGEKVTESYEALDENDSEDAIENGRDSLDYFARAADTASRKVVRTAEEVVYKNVMTKMAPQYFDNDLVSANIQPNAK